MLFAARYGLGKEKETEEHNEEELNESDQMVDSIEKHDKNQEGLVDNAEVEKGKDLKDDEGNYHVVPSDVKDNDHIILSDVEDNDNVFCGNYSLRLFMSRVNFFFVSFVFRRLE